MLIFDPYYGHGASWGCIPPELETFKSTKQTQSSNSQEIRQIFKRTFDWIWKCFPSFAEKTYLDKETQVLYVQPSRGKLAAFCSKLFTDEAFQNIGIAKEQRVNGEVCDIVYFGNKKPVPVSDLNDQDARTSLLSQTVFSEKPSVNQLEDGMESLLASQCAQGKYGRYRLLRANSASDLDLFPSNDKLPTTIAFYYRRQY